MSGSPIRCRPTELLLSIVEYWGGSAANGFGVDSRDSTDAVTHHVHHRMEFPGMSPKRRGPDGSTSARVVAQARTPDSRGGLLWIGAVVVLVVFAAVVIVTVTKPGGEDRSEVAAPSLNGPPATTAVGADTSPPWPIPGDTAKAVRAAGIPMLSAEGMVEHIHAHLDVLVDGRPVPVAASIGIDRVGSGVSPLHTHDDSGVLHVESPVERSFSLGELFTQWGVSLSADNVGALRSTDGNEIRAFVNGVQRPGNPAAITFADRDEVALVYGAPQSGESIPSRYDFATGL